mmetsp:Transcript_47141/g.156252  ORF Transcript_47141/g.156252 Transcript_47141/m.156252 type:complete len:200 (+) Transcript_47141:1622-2221(+)
MSRRRCSTPACSLCKGSYRGRTASSSRRSRTTLGSVTRRSTPSSRAKCCSHRAICPRRPAFSRLRWRRRHVRLGGEGRRLVQTRRRRRAAVTSTCSWRRCTSPSTGARTPSGWRARPPQSLLAGPRRVACRSRPRGSSSRVATSKRPFKCSAASPARAPSFWPRRRTSHFSTSTTVATATSMRSATWSWSRPTHPRRRT